MQRSIKNVILASIKLNIQSLIKAILTFLCPTQTIIHLNNTLIRIDRYPAVTGDGQGITYFISFIA